MSKEKKKKKGLSLIQGYGILCLISQSNTKKRGHNMCMCGIFLWIKRPPLSAYILLLSMACVCEKPSYIELQDPKSLGTYFTISFYYDMMKKWWGGWEETWYDQLLQRHKEVSWVTNYSSTWSLHDLSSTIITIYKQNLKRHQLWSDKALSDSLLTWFTPQYVLLSTKYWRWWVTRQSS